MSGVQFDQVTKRYPNGFEAVTELDLDVNEGELLVVVGPSGCGKTTTLRMLAGLESVSRGTIRIDGESVNSVAPRNRDIAMVFQSYALYPHLTVGGNLAYPLKLAGNTRAQINERVQKVASQLRLVDKLDRKPRQLSGGQRQRVAMGRAMVREPRVFLMDEPLSNLDAKLRVSMRAEVAELQRSLGTTMFYVTHDQTEAMTLGTRVAVMKDGVLQQCAAPPELYRRPANTFVATFIGTPPMNLLHGQLHRTDAGQLSLSTGSARGVLSGDADAAIPRAMLETPVIVGIRPEDIMLGHGHGPDAGLDGVVRMVEVLGSEQIVHVELLGASLIGPESFEDGSDDEDAPAASEARLLVKITDRDFVVHPGDAVAVTAAASRLEFFDHETSLALRDAAWSA